MSQHIWAEYTWFEKKNPQKLEKYWSADNG